MWISTDNCFVLDNHRVFYRIENMLGWSFHQQLFLWILLIFWKDEVRTKIIIFWRQHYYLLDIIKQVLILCRLWQFSYIFPILWGFKFWLSQYLVINDLCHPKKHHHFLSLDNFWLRVTVIAWEVSIGPLFTTSQHSLQYPGIYVNRTSLLIFLQQCNGGE